ncbi:MAG: GAF domain-containing protein [Proteobacteria bacterium]|nr:GAF domain-containing protein [Pseudomonadota bacterium]
MVKAKMRTPQALLKGERELECLYEISQCLVLSPNLHASVHRIMDALSEKMGMRRGTLTLLKPETNELIIEIAHGMPEEKKRRGKYKVGEGITGKVFETGEPVVVPQIGKEPLFLNRTKWRGDITKQNISFICVPIKIGKNVIGTFSVDRLFDEDISFEEDVRLLTIIASMIAYAVKLNQVMEQEKASWVTEKTKLQEELEERYNITHLIGTSRPMEEVYRRISQVAMSNATVLIRGESGTGKELVAHAIHYNSARAAKPFIKVSCAALPESLLESELFGHEKGAFTGAIEAKKGRFELAQGGTVFLDEVGEFNQRTQIKLLRVLQEREFERLGGTRTIRGDFRIIAATNKDLERALDEGKFREDLYYRLNVFPIYIPPLRDRKTDILLLTEHFIAKYAREHGKEIKRITTPAIDMLMAYHWPGNVRELENWIETAVLVCDDKVIHSYHFPPTLQTAEASGTQIRAPLAEALTNYEREIIIDALKSARGNKAKAARLLSTTERIIGYRIKKLHIEPPKYRS